MKHCDSELLLDHFLSLFDRLAEVKENDCPTVLRVQKEKRHLTFSLHVVYQGVHTHTPAYTHAHMVAM